MNEDEYIEKSVQFAKGTMELAFRMGYATRDDEIVRCKDCKHTEYEDDGEIICTFWDFCDCNHHVLKNGFCDRAERKEE